MKIYRLEHRESKFGFWQHKNKTGQIEYFYTNESDRIIDRCCDEKHPNTRNDFGDTVTDIVFENGWAHGCHTLNHFYAWFEKDWYALIEYGFGLFEYNIEDNTQYIVGKSQIVFNQKSAINIREISITEYEEALQ